MTTLTTDTGEIHLAPDVGAAAAGAFAAAVVALSRSASIDLGVELPIPIVVTIEALGVRGAIALLEADVYDPEGLARIFVFDDREAYATYLRDRAWRRPGTPSGAPPHVEVALLPREDAEPAVGEQLDRLGWQVAGAPYVIVGAAAAGAAPRPVTARELSMLEAFALALTHADRDADVLERLAEAASEGERTSRTVRVAAHAGELEVALELGEAPAAEWRTPRQLVDELLVPRAADADVKLHAFLYKAAVELVAQAAREDVPREELVRSAATSLLVESIVVGGPTFLAFDPAGLEHLLFERFPVRVPLEPRRAAGQVEGLRAFFAFLLEEAQAPWAQACLDALGGDTAARFEAALADTSRYDEAKQAILEFRNWRPPGPSAADRAERARRAAAAAAAHRDEKRRRKAKRAARAKRR
ncbi:MAG: hypothetical protein IT376_19205 [Polyangiaceae bacterium]|nr:hypothetical protein [Polyangiaceae bacterium]